MSIGSSDSPAAPDRRSFAIKRPIKVLLIDDDATLGEALVGLLQEDGFEVAKARGGEEGLQKIETALPDVVLLDIALPDTDGLSVLKRIRRNRSSTVLPVLMFTASSDTDTLVDAFNNGADDFIPKPFQFPVVAARIRTQAKRKFADDARQMLLDGLELQVKIRTTDLEIRNAELESEIQRGRQIEFALNAAKSEAEQSNTAKLRFMQSMSHELGTPLNAIIGFSDLVLSGIYGELSPPEYRRYIEDVRDSAKHLQAVLQNTLDFTHSDGGTISLNPHETTVKAIAKRATKLVSHLAERNGVSIVVDDAANDALTVDAATIARVVTNLLSNALRHSPQESTVTVGARSDADTVILSVTDKGGGMSDETLASITEPFAQSDEHFVKIWEGPGLGLSVSRYLVELNGGTLTIDSRPGDGTTVNVTLPRTPPDSAA